MRPGDMPQAADGTTVLPDDGCVTDPDPRPCIGCLDSRECWVCTGTGYHHPLARRGLCGRCAGTGVCAMCAKVEPEVALPAPLIPPPRTTPTPTAQP
jgi:hypothetical protein